MPIRFAVFTSIASTLLFALVLGGAQAQSTSDQANALYLKKDYAAAISAYKDVVAANPSNAQAWYRLAVSLQAQKTYDEAVADYQQALKLGFDVFSVNYRLATLEGARGNEAAAMAYLERADAARRIPPADLTADKSLNAVQSDPRFAAMVDRNAHFFFPCTFDQRFHAMDFWIGDWSVSDKSGNQIGSSHIQQINNTCTLLENWESASGADIGKSFTFFDSEHGRWVQHWVDGYGTYLDYAGASEAKSVVFTASTFTYPTHTPVVRRMTFTLLDDGRVRQLIENSPDGRSNWTTTFDGYYAKSKS